MSEADAKRMGYRDGLLQEVSELGRELAFRDTKPSGDCAELAAIELRLGELRDILGEGDANTALFYGYRAWAKEAADEENIRLCSGDGHAERPRQ